MIEDVGDGSSSGVCVIVTGVPRAGDVLPGAVAVPTLRLPGPAIEADVAEARSHPAATCHRQADF
jgi:hypothetical protein